MTINFIYSPSQLEEQTLSIEKLELVIHLCQLRLEKDIDLPLTHITFIRTDFVLSKE